MLVYPHKKNMGSSAGKFWLLSLLLILVGCIFESEVSEPRKDIICNQPLKVAVISNEIKNTFYPNSKLEQAKDLLDPEGSYHKYGMNFNTSVRVQNLNEADLAVKSSIGYLMIKYQGMEQKTFQSVLPAFVVKAKSDTVIHFGFKVDIKTLSVDYFKLIVASEKVGYFFKSAHKYSFADDSICSDTSLVVNGVNASDSTLKDYVSIPEITDATYTGAMAASEATTASVNWSIDNWDSIKCALFVLVVLLGIILGGHAGSGSC
jgi:hypothetical protein